MKTSHTLLAFSLPAALAVPVLASTSHADAPAGRYTLTDDAVHDTQTKLTWERKGPTSAMNWADATGYCASLALHGTGWHLPSPNELISSVDHSRRPAIDPPRIPTPRRRGIGPPPSTRISPITHAQSDLPLASVSSTS